MARRQTLGSGRDDAITSLDVGHLMRVHVHHLSRLLTHFAKVTWCKFLHEVGTRAAPLFRFLGELLLELRSSHSGLGLPE